jgi:hypothetical protein
MNGAPGRPHELPASERDGSPVGTPGAAREGDARLADGGPVHASLAHGAAAADAGRAQR